MHLCLDSSFGLLLLGPWVFVKAKSHNAVAVLLLLQVRWQLSSFCLGWIGGCRRSIDRAIAGLARRRFGSGAGRARMTGSPQKTRNGTTPELPLLSLGERLLRLSYIAVVGMEQQYVGIRWSLAGSYSCMRCSFLDVGTDIWIAGNARLPFFALVTRVKSRRAWCRGRHK